MTADAPWLLRLPPARRPLLLLGLGVVVAMWVREASRSGSLGAAVLAFVIAPVALSMPLSLVNHPGAQLVCRGVWWFQLLFGTVAAVVTSSWEPAVIALGAGLAFLEAGGAGLGEDDATRGSFAPVAFRRSLMVSIAMATAEVQLLGGVSAALMSERDGHLRGFALGAAGCGVLLGLAAVGLYRLRFWGVLLHLAAMVGVASLVASAVPAQLDHDSHPILVWVATVAAQMLLPLPMVLAIARRRPVRPSSPSRLPGRLLRGLVVGMMFASAAGGLASRLH